MMTADETRLECLTLAMELGRDWPAAEVAQLAMRLEQLVARATEGLKKPQGTAGWTPERRAAQAEVMRTIRAKPGPGDTAKQERTDIEKFIAEKGVTKVAPGYAAETSAARR